MIPVGVGMKRNDKGIKVAMVAEYKITKVSTFVYNYDFNITDEIGIANFFKIRRKFIERNPMKMQEAGVPNEYRDEIQGQLEVLIKECWDNQGFLVAPEQLLPSLKAHFKEFTYEANLGLSSLSHRLPGMDERVSCPCKCGMREVSVRNLIIHLNDKVKWPREDIADWLDDLQDKHGYNFEFELEKA
jgi:hypothetical protein